MRRYPSADPCNEKPRPLELVTLALISLSLRDMDVTPYLVLDTLPINVDDSMTISNVFDSSELHPHFIPQSLASCPDGHVVLSEPESIGREAKKTKKQPQVASTDIMNEGEPHHIRGDLQRSRRNGIQ
ncbi:hypothetical protein MRX96_004530 [Rhipicephalus microplus]